MASVATRILRAYTRFLYEEAVDGSTTLAAMLKAARKARIEGMQRGKILVATAANGHSTQFQIPEDFSATDAIEMVEEIQTRYDEARAKLIADGTPSPTDAQIYAEIMTHLQRVDSFQSDFTNIRVEEEESSED